MCIIILTVRYYILFFQLIFSGEYTKAMNKDWHSGHFCCWQCDESLTGQRYVLRDEHPYCIKCYESVFANPCDECDKTIGIDSKVSSTPLTNYSEYDRVNYKRIVYQLLTKRTRFVSFFFFYL